MQVLIHYGYLNGQLMVIKLLRHNQAKLFLVSILAQWYLVVFYKFSIFLSIMFTCDWQIQVQTRLLLHQQRELYHPEYQVQLSRLYRVKGKEINVSFCQDSIQYIISICRNTHKYWCSTKAFMIQLKLCKSPPWELEKVARRFRGMTSRKRPPLKSLTTAFCFTFSTSVSFSSSITLCTFTCKNGDCYVTLYYGKCHL